MSKYYCFLSKIFFSILMYYYLTNSICGPVHLPLFEAKAHKFLFCAWQKYCNEKLHIWPLILECENLPWHFFSFFHIASTFRMGKGRKIKKILSAQTLNFFYEFHRCWSQKLKSIRLIIFRWRQRVNKSYYVFCWIMDILASIL